VGGGDTVDLEAVLFGEAGGQLLRVGQHGSLVGRELRRLGLQRSVRGSGGRGRRGRGRTRESRAKRDLLERNGERGDGVVVRPALVAREHGGCTRVREGKMDENANR
jgi:hypothetical protein